MAQKTSTNSPLISVILLCYNSAPYLAASIESILKQTYPDWELLILDDGSTDGSRQIAERYAQKDARLKLIKNERNLGIVGNRNKGLRLARGRYIAWQDADDISLPKRLQKQVAFMETHPEVGICGGFLQFFDDRGMRGERRYAPDDATLRDHIFRYSPVAQPAAMIRRSVLKMAGPFDERWSAAAEDLDLSFRLGEVSKFANLQEVVLRYRQHPSSATFKKLRLMELNTLAIRRQYAHSHGYRMSFADRLYNFVHYLSVFLVPPRWKIRLFDWLRNTRQPKNENVNNKAETS